MSWTRSVNYSEADGSLREIYDRLGPYLDNIITAHGLRPHHLEGHLAVYKSALHHSGNLVPKVFLEAIGVFVSLKNGCSYCVAHHRKGVVREAESPELADAMLAALYQDAPGEPYTLAQQAALRYAAKLCLRPADVNESDILTMRSAGLTDGEILEINQVTAYFSYANRVVLGLGVRLE